MDDIFVYYVDFPDGIREFITPCLEGYTIYIDKKLPREAKLKAYNHAMRHIEHRDYDNIDVQNIEYARHNDDENIF